MKILFTGNRGNLGKEIIPLLEEDHSVQCYNIDYSNFDAVNSFFRHREIDFIIHAAIRGGRRVRADIADDFYNNMMMFENLAAQNNLISYELMTRITSRVKVIFKNQ